MDWKRDSGKRIFLLVRMEFKSTGIRHRRKHDGATRSGFHPTDGELRGVSVEVVDETMYPFYGQKLVLHSSDSTRVVHALGGNYIVKITLAVEIKESLNEIL